MAYPDFPILQVPLAKLRESRNLQALLAKLPSGETMPVLMDKDGAEDGASAACTNYVVPPYQPTA